MGRAASRRVIQGLAISAIASLISITSVRAGEKIDVAETAQVRMPSHEWADDPKRAEDGAYVLAHVSAGAKCIALGGTPNYETLASRFIPRRCEPSRQAGSNEIECFATVVINCLILGAEAGSRRARPVSRESYVASDDPSDVRPPSFVFAAKGSY